MNKYVCAILTIVVTGCASGPLPVAHRPETAVVNIPDLNTEAAAEIGQTITAKANVSKVPALVLSSTVSEVVNFPGATTIQAGTLPLFASNEAGKFYWDEKATYRTLGQTVPATRAGIYVPDDKSQPSVIFHFAMKYMYGKTPVAGLTTTVSEKWNPQSFKRELVYTGVSQNTVSILYREFSGEMARPAFSQELKYDLSQGSTIGYKGARFEILKATNTEIRYKVTKALD